jgi:alanyl-tRNA synthetase
MTTTAGLRQQFLDYFKDHEHALVASSPLVPANDPTLLFTNAGMVQFKETFLGTEKRAYARAASSQRCVRAGGKHNDLDNVGYTARHHTFFEMLGNFSFGDYFKREAIAFAWEFLTVNLKLPAEKLWVTVYKDDKESEDIWLKEMKVDPKRFSRCGDKDNFWAMGDTGPCGPCTEIFYDHGDAIPGGPPGSPDQEADRYIEIWNLVFMQYERQADGSLKDLPKPSVDTGMGLERIAAVMQGVHSNYEIDLFQALIKAAGVLSGCTDLENHSLKVIADHIRSTAFLIADGITPSNEGRGYVLRRIIRRALRHGHQLGAPSPFFFELVDALVKEMGGAYPELIKKQSHIKDTIKREEDQFNKTLDRGLKVLNEEIKACKGTEIPGDIVFKLYDTFGFPMDLTADIARENKMTIDEAGCQACMEDQRGRGRQQGRFKVDYTALVNLDCRSEFSGYDTLTHEAKLLFIIKDNDTVDSGSQGETLALVLDRTPFYAESGGQVGDAGRIVSGDNVFIVSDTQKAGDAIIHHGVVDQGHFNTGIKVNATVDTQKRQATRLNHSATHLLHAAMHVVLGDHVVQRGSLVSALHLRFDFAHHEAVTDRELKTIEALVNDYIRANYPVTTDIMTPEQAKADGAMALFGEKYGDKVRVLSMGDVSKELCGGTHVDRTGDIGFFKITSESAIAAGVRRIEGVTGHGALRFVQDTVDTLSQSAACFNTNPNSLTDKIRTLQKQSREFEKEASTLKSKLAGQSSKALLDQVKDVNGMKLLAAKMENVDAKTLRELADQLKNQLGSAIVVLGSAQSKDKVSLVASITKDLTSKIQAGKLINHVATQVGGKGGGRPDMAQAGGNDASKLDGALNSVEKFITEISAGRIKE